MANATGLGPILLLAGIVIVLGSPRKLKTLVRILSVSVVTALVLLVIGALLRKGDPEMLGALSVQIALGVGDAFGVFHVLRLKKSQPSQPS